MTRPTDLVAVQFMHPGGEHWPTRDGRKDWNHGGHARKFMRSPGSWLDSADRTAETRTGDVVFWGEWEPPSNVIDRFTDTGGGLPNWLNEPVWDYPPVGGSPQNTDPYVFGERFLYSNCRQNTKRAKLRTQRLAIGSLILFGSHRAGEFLLDTVMVVSGSRPLDETALFDPDLDPVFRTVTAELLFPRTDRSTFRLYEGATPEDDVAGMFSFVPCLPYSRGRGFARPTIRLDRVVNPRNRQALKFTDVEFPEVMHDLWLRVVDQVLDQGLVLGVHLATPGLDVLGGSEQRRGQAAGACSPAIPVAAIPVNPTDSSC